jgi:hypothetical protein
MLRITDTTGKLVRELQIPAAKNAAGIQMVCWDLRGEPLPVVAGGNGGGGGRGAGGGGGGRGAAARGGVPQFPDQAEPGYMPSNPCGGAGGRGGFGGFGGGAQAPYVMPGKYNVALLSNGKVIDTRPMTIIMDPAVRMTVAERKRYNDIVNDLQMLHERGQKVASALGTMMPQMKVIDSTLNARSDVPAAVKTQFASLKKEYDALAPHFGVGTAPATPPVGGGRGAGVVDTSVYGRTVALKGQLMNIWELPGEGLSRQYADVKVALPRELTAANAFMTQARAAAAALAKYNLTLTVPPR